MRLRIQVAFKVYLKSLDCEAPWVVLEMVAMPQWSWYLFGVEMRNDDDYRFPFQRLCIPSLTSCQRGLLSLNMKLSCLSQRDRQRHQRDRQRHQRDLHIISKRPTNNADALNTISSCCRHCNNKTLVFGILDSRIHETR